VTCNRWVNQEIRFPTLRQRLFALIETCDAALALPGGPGTLAEVAVMWNHLLTEAIPPRPLILIGPGWKSTFDAFYSALGDYTAPQHRRWLSFADTVNTAVSMLKDHNENVKGDK
jgi:predicted Rossmann-fold nucleotide-binding protein